MRLNIVINAYFSISLRRINNKVFTYCKYKVNCRHLVYNFQKYECRTLELRLATYWPNKHAQFRTIGIVGVKHA